MALYQMVFDSGTYSFNEPIMFAVYANDDTVGAKDTMLRCIFRSNDEAENYRKEHTKGVISYYVRPVSLWEG